MELLSSYSFGLHLPEFLVSQFSRLLKEKEQWIIDIEETKSNQELLNEFQHIGQAGLVKLDRETMEKDVLAHLKEERFKLFHPILSKLNSDMDDIEGGLDGFSVVSRSAAIFLMMDVAMSCKDKEITKYRTKMAIFRHCYLAHISRS